MNPELFQKQAQYNRWANEKLYAFLATFGDASILSPRSTIAGSISGALHHLLISDSFFLAALTGDERGFRLRNHLGDVLEIESTVQRLYNRFSELRVARRHLDQQIIEYLSVVNAAELDELVAFFDLDGERRKLLRWQLLADVFTHQVHHRGQLTATLSVLGTPVSSIEFSTFLRVETTSSVVALTAD
jgi:uncharacterized damage-inducible protein DinB